MKTTIAIIAFMAVLNCWAGIGETRSACEKEWGAPYVETATESPNVKKKMNAFQEFDDKEKKAAAKTSAPTGKPLHYNWGAIQVMAEYENDICVRVCYSKVSKEQQEKILKAKSNK